MGGDRSGLTWTEEHLPASGLGVLSKEQGRYPHSPRFIIADPSDSRQPLGLLSGSEGGPPSVSRDTGQPHEAPAAVKVSQGGSDQNRGFPPPPIRPHSALPMELPSLPTPGLRLLDRGHPSNRGPSHLHSQWPTACRALTWAGLGGTSDLGKSCLDFTLQSLQQTFRGHPYNLVWAAERDTKMNVPRLLSLGHSMAQADTCNPVLQ